MKMIQILSALAVLPMCSPFISTAKENVTAPRRLARLDSDVDEYVVECRVMRGAASPWGKDRAKNECTATQHIIVESGIPEAFHIGGRVWVEKGQGKEVQSVDLGLSLTLTVMSLPDNSVRANVIAERREVDQTYCAPQYVKRSREDGSRVFDNFRVRVTRIEALETWHLKETYKLVLDRSNDSEHWIEFTIKKIGGLGETFAF